MKMHLTRSLLFAFALCLISMQLLAQAAPILGSEAVVSLAPDASPVAPDGKLSVPVYVEIAGVTGRSAEGAVVDAVLGGYQIEITFDHTRLRLEGVSGGAGGFEPPPVFTALQSANGKGRFIVAAAQATDLVSPPRVHVATLEFTALRAGDATVTVKPISLASGILDGAGPAAISGKGSTASVPVRDGVGRKRAIRR